jgi:hypothetical protein
MTCLCFFILFFLSRLVSFTLHQITRPLAAFRSPQKTELTLFSSFHFSYSPHERFCLPSSWVAQCNMNESAPATATFWCVNAVPSRNWRQRHALQCHASRPMGERALLRDMHRRTHKHSREPLCRHNQLFTRPRSVLLLVLFVLVIFMILLRSFHASRPLGEKLHTRWLRFKARSLAGENARNASVKPFVLPSSMETFFTTEKP